MRAGREKCILCPEKAGVRLIRGHRMRPTGQKRILCPQSFGGGARRRSGPVQAGAGRCRPVQAGVFSNGEDLFMTVTLSSNGAIFMPDNPSIRFRNFEGTQLVLQGTSIGRTAPLISDQANTTQYVAAQFLVLPGQIDFFRSGIQSIQITTAPKVHEISFRKDRIGLKLYKDLLRQSQNPEME